MKQILAIFRKDALRFWPEILVYASMLAAFVLVYPLQWHNVNGERYRALPSFVFADSPAGLVATCLVILVPVCWWVLTARVVHGERLIGTTQFWLARPYEWTKLLGAKALFSTAFLFAPFLAAQMVLLAEGGFNPFLHLPGLFYDLLLVAGILVLPLAAFSVVTSGFGRMTLVILGVAIFMASVSMLFSLRSADSAASAPGSLGDKLQFVIVACGCAAAILIQYAGRKLKFAWLSIIATGLIVTAIAFIDPDLLLMNRSYPTQPTARPVGLKYLQSPFVRSIANEASDKRYMRIGVPVLISGIPSGHAMITSALKATIDGPSGVRWESPWQVINNGTYLPQPQGTYAGFPIPRQLYDSLKSTPLRLRLTYAVENLRAAGSTTVPLSRSDFAVPSLGVCTPQVHEFFQASQIWGISCRTAMRRPDLTYVTVRWADEECSAQPKDTDGPQGYAWIGSVDSDPADFGITSVWNNLLPLDASWTRAVQDNPPHIRQLCPGTPVTFTRYSLVGRSQVSLTIPDFRLPELALGDQYRHQYGN